MDDLGVPLFSETPMSFHFLSRLCVFFLNVFNLLLFFFGFCRNSWRIRFFRFFLPISCLANVTIPLTTVIEIHDFDRQKPGAKKAKKSV